MSGRDQADRLWFNNNHAEIVVAHRDNADGLSVIDMTLPFDEAPPLHVHHEEDEVFHILAGEIRFSVDGGLRTVRAGDTLLAPRGIPHGFRVLTPAGARMLVITRGGFEAVVRAVSRPAAVAGLPEQVAPSQEVQAELTRQCALRKIDIVGPPIN